jgi:hypothetical protein
VLNKMQATAAQKAKEGKSFRTLNSFSAQLRRSRDKSKQANSMTQYYYVIGGFAFVMIAAFLYTVLNPPQSFATMPIVNESQILVHNGG